MSFFLTHAAEEDRNSYHQPAMCITDYTRQHLYSGPTSCKAVSGMYAHVLSKNMWIEEELDTSYFSIWNL